MNIFEEYMKAADKDKAFAMSKYMKNRFAFLGIQQPERKKLNAEFIKQKKKESQVDWEFVFHCYDNPFRELHYLAISYLDSIKGKIKEEDIDKLQKLLTTNSWWDSVDPISGICGYLLLKYPALKSSIRSWIDNENLWLKRAAIICQLKYKEKTDTEFLSEAIKKNMDSNEFFINKAIGWALREYSKTDVEWVREFIKHHTLSNLSKREASKYL